MHAIKGQHQTLKANTLVDWQPTHGFELDGSKIKPPCSGNQSGSSVLDSLQSQNMFLRKSGEQLVRVV